MDFVHDQLATGAQDPGADDRRHLLALLAGARCAVQLSRRGRRRDARAGLRRRSAIRRRSASTRAPSSSRRDLDLWAYANGVTLDFSRPGKPTDNAFTEAFNGRLRAECLNAHWFLTLADAREKLEAWRRYYNEERPHGAIGHKPPIALQNPGGAASPPP